MTNQLCSSQQSNYSFLKRIFQIMSQRTKQQKQRCDMRQAPEQLYNSCGAEPASHRQQLRLSTEFRTAQQPVHNLALFEAAWDECIELQSTPKDLWVGRVLLHLGAMPRYELAVLGDSGVLGGLVLVLDDSDVHVGACASVHALYVHTASRGTGVVPMLMREVMRLCKLHEVPILAYTHRVGPWKYSTIYKRIR